jgi:hypothetical protein
MVSFRLCAIVRDLRVGERFDPSSAWPTPGILLLEARDAAVVICRASLCLAAICLSRGEDSGSGLDPDAEAPRRAQMELNAACALSFSLLARHLDRRSRRGASRPGYAKAAP